MKNDIQTIDESNYIDSIKSKLTNIDDIELRNLIERLIEEREQLAEILDVDPLTGLYNRRILDRIRDFTTVAICDIDNFKQINDTYGHLIGDKVLQIIAHTLSKNVRVNDYVCRFGGDEFILIFCGADENVVKRRMEKLIESVNSMLILNDFKITVSIGVSSYKRGISLKNVINQADKALYISKETGKNAVNCYSDLATKNSSLKFNL